ncbi:CYTH and CHAD domain-containing protein [Streptomyces sp. BPTC-684]|uniref:CYTH and CHAD domain-containing protein n=1 Tax=Streptomyces sp. BPTC-684 TaxID=3043734 RepID=UPI0024B21430|nr:CYTH and CHAD domain-containing protein [Streptomyces sp. BPTC-684]WHM38754.1 CYTH and CHAD domain-containing protein [Streptomyces sp. BPTC-684]
MAETKREIERKYEATGDDVRLPDLTKVAGVAGAVDKGVVELDAVYYDTQDLRLAADSLTLRRRTGGDDAGWHLKFPVATGIRDEIRAPLSPDVPRTLAALLRSRVRDSRPTPVVRLLSSRDVRHLLDEDGTLLAEVSVDAVRAERLGPAPGATAAWTEVEVELADEVDPALLDRVEKRLRKAGLRPSHSASKLARALAETAPEAPVLQKAPAPDRTTAGDHVLGYLRAQRDALIDLDPAVRRDLPDSVHQMRVATRRLRSAFKSYGKVLDRTVTDPVGEELKWLAAELGVDRDQEVLTERLQGRIAALPRPLLLGPVRGRLRIWSTARRSGSRRKTIAVLDSKRYLALLDTLDALLDGPPLRPAARRPVAQVVPQAVIKDYDRLAGRIAHALELGPGEPRDLAMHDARKAAKRARYAAEAAKPALGAPAKKFAQRMKAVQTVLGDHQDSVVAREALRGLAIQAHLAGESAFAWGLLYGQEVATAADRERELPEVWRRASRPDLRERLRA